MCNNSGCYLSCQATFDILAKHERSQFNFGCQYDETVFISKFGRIDKTVACDAYLEGCGGICGFE